MIQIYRRIINFGKKIGLLPPTFQNLASDVVQHVERPRDRWVNPNEMPRLLKAINNVENSRERYVQLSPTAFDILTKLPLKPGNPYIFPSSIVPGQHLKYIYTSWQHVRAEAGLNDLTIHDLRRTCGSMLAQRGVSLVLIAEILGHRDLSSVEDIHQI